MPFFGNTSWTEGRYTWRHNQALRILAAALEEGRKKASSNGVQNQSFIPFVKEGQKAAPANRRRVTTAKEWLAARKDWMATGEDQLATGKDQRQRGETCTGDKGSVAQLVGLQQAVTQHITTSRQRKKQPVGSARAGMEDEPVGTDRMETTRVRSGLQTAIDKRKVVMRTCSCGWKKDTTYRGLRIHQGKTNCQGKRQHTRTVSTGQTEEDMGQVSTHRTQDLTSEAPSQGSISTPLVSAVEVRERTVPEPRVEPVSQQEVVAGATPSPQEPAPERREKVKWPRANNKEEWEKLDDDLHQILEQGLKGDVERKLNQFGNLVYSYCSERFGTYKKEGKEAREKQTSRREREIATLVRRRRQLRKRWRKAKQEEKEGLEPWSELETAIKKARAGSAPGPNGVSYQIYKKCPKVGRLLWKLFRVAWKKQCIPSAWRRAGGVLIPKEKVSTDIKQFRNISLLNVEGKLFFSILTKRMITYLLANNYIDTEVQKAGVPGFPGCIEHASTIWQQIQMARRQKEDLHVVWLDLTNAYGAVPHSVIHYALNFFWVPETIRTMIQNYFQDFREPVKSLGRLYTCDIADTKRGQELVKQAVEGLRAIDKCELPGKLKVWCLQKEYKLEKVRTALELKWSQDNAVRAAYRGQKTGRKWNPDGVIDQAVSRLKHRDIVGAVQQGRFGLGWGERTLRWDKATQREKKQLVVDEVKRMMEEERKVKVVGQHQQGAWINWESTVDRKLTWKNMWDKPDHRLSFLIRAAYDILPCPRNLSRWYSKEESCDLCGAKKANLKHILSACTTSLKQGRYTWRHNQALRILAAALEEGRKKASSNGVQNQSFIPFVKEGQKAAPANRRRGEGLMSKGGWEMTVDLDTRLTFPRTICETTLRPDIVLWSPTQRTVVIVELTVPWEENVQAAFERKKLKYQDLVQQCVENSWRALLYPVEVGCRGFVGTSITRLCRELSLSHKQLVKALSEEVERCSFWLWVKRKDQQWGTKEK
ncbi:uncharacterized protein LOC144877779 [Branchiostoma floridae x Branchiostoma japonicum]